LVDERCEVACRQLDCPPLGESVPPSGKNQPGRGEVVVLTQDEVGSEVAGGPRFEHGGRIGTELDQKIAELLTLCCVEENLRHVAGL
jgi:hypothetical protein